MPPLWYLEQPAKTKNKGPGIANFNCPMVPLVLPLIDTVPVYPGPAYGAWIEPNIIAMDDDKSIANIFCFGAFAGKKSGIVYHNLTGSFLFVSFDSSVCFFILYYYESNAILITPISGLDDMSLFNAYKTEFDELTAKGFKPKLNIMDNQATRHIKKYLTEDDCKLQVVESTNHCVNAAK
jgi:hypothetical protein